jgi:phenylalanyl-tRNA synthetase alpha chain
MDKEELERAVLNNLLEKDIPSSYDFVNGDSKQHLDLIGVLKSLEVSQIITMTQAGEHYAYKLNQEAQGFVADGSLEAQFFHAIDKTAGTPRNDLMAKFGKAGGIAFAGCMRNKWIKATDGIITAVVPSIVDQVQLDLQQIASGNVPSDDARLQKALNDLKKRKLVEVSATKFYSISKGPQFTTERKQLIRDLDVNALRSGSWASDEFKEYNLAAEGKPVHAGALHPLQKVRAEFRSILVQMGFTEMPTNNYVESSFWNFDSLFQPQQHPARDAHDTFFIAEPSNADANTVAPADYVSAVKSTHEVGGFGSIGYRYDWKLDEATKNILRTHTTASSSRMLFELAQEFKATGVFTPRKYFSIDRVFRNETLDATHLAEFHQVEGLVADRDLTLGHLIGVIQAFFRSIGIEDVRFKPAYNPYTEPSMEIFGYSRDLGKWMEVGNSGMFRPEMLRPMGFPDDVRVIAWGLSLERPTMIKYGLKNIRDLVGPKMQLKVIEKNPIARYP